MSVLLVRHGESVWNAEGRWQGRADPPLSSRGVDQARRAAERLAALAPIGAVVASTLQRAAETARIIALELGLAPPALHAGLVERDVGEWSGLRASEIDHRWPGARANGDWPRGWEPDAVLAARSRRAVARLASADSPVIAVTHGGVIRALETHLGALEVTPVANLEARWVEWRAARLVLGARVRLVEAEAALQD